MCSKLFERVVAVSFEDPLPIIFAPLFFPFLSFFLFSYHICAPLPSTLADLENVGKPALALETLHDVITNRRYTKQWTKVHEDIMVKYIDLCINLRKVRCRN